MQAPPELNNTSQQIGPPPLPQPNHSEQFAKNIDKFLKGQSLQDWEQAALRSYVAISIIRQILGLFLVLVALDAASRLILLFKLAPNLKAGMMVDLFGFVVVGIFGLVSFFKLRWWMVMTTAIAIVPFNLSSWHIGTDLFSATAIAVFPFVLGYIIGIVWFGIIFMGVPMLWRANRELYLSASDYEVIKFPVSEIASGKRPDLWSEIGKVIGSFGTSNTVRVRFFDNGALFLLGKKTFNTIINNDADQCVLKVTKKDKKFLKKWPVQGKLLEVNIALTDEGYARLQGWLRKVPVPTQVACPAQAVESASR